MGLRLREVIDESASSTHETVEVDVHDLEQAQQDPCVRELLADARAYGAAVEREGRNR